MMDETPATNHNAPAIEHVPRPNVASMNDARLNRIEWAHTRLMLYLVVLTVTIQVLILIGVAAILALLMHSVVLPSYLVPGP